MSYDLKNYIPVQERINQFWEKYPNGRITTALCSDPDNFEVCRYRGEVYADREDTRPIATGYAFEIAGRGMANKTSHEENCETSAIGRALANLGFATTHADRPSQEEMAKVQRMHEEIASQSNVPPPPAAPNRPPPSRISAVRQQRANEQPAGPTEDDAVLRDELAELGSRGFDLNRFLTGRNKELGDLSRGELEGILPTAREVVRKRVERLGQQAAAQ
jgi:hypothetical protein